MKLARFIYQGTETWGMVEGEDMVLLDGDVFGEDVTNKFQASSKRVPASEVELLAPCRPAKCVCIGLNYSDHAAELKMPVPAEPIMFLKPPTALCAPGGDILYPSMTEMLHYEAELGVVMGRQAKNISEADVPEYVLGYTCANDVTARDLQKRDGQWTRAKSFDTFLPVGPYLETDMDPHTADIRLVLNGEERQSSNTKQFLFNIPALVSFISKVMTLEPGDIIITGTPPGVGEMKVGDTVTVEIDGIGALTNTVVQGE